MCMGRAHSLVVQDRDHELALNEKLAELVTIDGELKGKVPLATPHCTR